MKRLAWLGVMGTVGLLAAACGDAGTPSVDEAHQPLGPAPSGPIIPGPVGGPRFSPSVAVHGMCSTMKAIDLSSERCTLADLPDLLAFLASDAINQPVLDFLNDAVAPFNGELQCSSYVDAGVTKYCVDVVDRDVNGLPLDQGMKNYFVAYTADMRMPLAPDAPNWDQALLDPNYIAPPVELSVAGYVTRDCDLAHPASCWKTSTPATFPRDLRVLKFDPRDCMTCGNYKGPGYKNYWLSRVGFSDADYAHFWPALPSFSYWGYSCAYERDASASSYMLLTKSQCDSEELYYRMER